MTLNDTIVRLFHSWRDEASCGLCIGLARKTLFLSLIEIDHIAFSLESASSVYDPYLVVSKTCLHCNSPTNLQNSICLNE